MEEVKKDIESTLDPNDRDYGPGWGNPKRWGMAEGWTLAGRDFAKHNHFIRAFREAQRSGLARHSEF
jgi:hypothetical protein